MPGEVKKINVRIGGMNYQLVSAQDEKYMRQIAAQADAMIHRVMQNSPQLSHNMSTVLALVNALDELTQTRQKEKTFDDNRLEIENQVKTLDAELSQIRAQNWDMKKEILRLQALCRDYETLLEDAVAAETVAEEALTGRSDTEASEPETQDGDFKQTNLDDYLDGSGWPKPVREDSHDQ